MEKQKNAKCLYVIGTTNDNIKMCDYASKSQM